MPARRLKATPVPWDREPMRTCNPVPLVDVTTTALTNDPTPVKFELYGQELVEKEVRPNGSSGRIYLPPDWIGSVVKIIRVG